MTPTSRHSSTSPASSLEVGESTAELAAKYPGGELGPTLDPVPFPTSRRRHRHDLYIRQDKFRGLRRRRPGELADLMAVTQRPIAAAALEDKATKAAWKTIPNWTMVTTEDLEYPRRLHALHGRAGESHTIEVDASTPSPSPSPCRRRPDRRGRPRDRRLTARRMPPRWTSFERDPVAPGG